MTQPSGWYDDPQDSTQLRYWDGVVWSSHVTPKISPTVAQSNIGMPYGVTPAAARPSNSGSHGGKGAPPASGGFGSPQQGPAQQGQWQGQPQQGQTPQDQQQGGQWPAYGQGPGSLPDYAGWQSHHLPTTPDGVVLSGWWKRVLARIIDNIITSLVALPLAFVPLRNGATVFWEYLQEAMAAAEAGGQVPAQPGAEMTTPILQVSLIVLVVYLVYEIGFLTLSGATIGRRIVGISVRLRDKPGPPPLAVVLKRTAVKEVGSLVGSVPILGLFGSVFGLLDVLWPLWDSKNQAIHDKVAATNVVVGPQPKRDAGRFPDAT